MPEMEPHDELQELMQGELDVLERLEGALNDENSALRSNDTVALEQAVDAKQSALAELEQSEGRRQALVEGAGFEPGTGEGVEQFIGSAPEELGAALAEQWQAVCDRLEQCRDQNLVNGQLLEASRQNTHHALSILRGDSAAETYDRQGGKSPAGGGRSYAKA